MFVNLKLLKITRRRFLGAAAFSAAATCFYTWRIEPHWVEVVRRRLAALDSPPPAAGVPLGPMAAGIAALPADQRNAAIRSMVDRLATRLAEDGTDQEGWLRLVRAYKVLGDTPRADKALNDARKSMSGNAGALSRLDGLAQELGLGG